MNYKPYGADPLHIESSSDSVTTQNSAAPLFTLIAVLVILISSIIGSAVYFVIKNDNGSIKQAINETDTPLGVAGTYRKHYVSSNIYLHNNLSSFPLCSLSTAITDTSGFHDLHPAGKEDNALFAQRINDVLTQSFNAPIPIVELQACAYFPQEQNIHAFLDAVIVYKIIWDSNIEFPVNLAVSGATPIYIGNKPMLLWSQTNEDGTLLCSTLVDSQILIEVYAGRGGTCIPPRSIAESILNKSQ